MGASTSEAPNDFESLKPGGHVCVPHKSAAEKYDVLASFIRSGIMRGERCVYWADPAELLAAAPYLEARGVPVTALRDRSALQMVGWPPAAADLEIPSALIRAAAASARADGYTGLRVAGSACARARMDSQQLARFERRLSSLYLEARAIGLCMFDHGSTEPGLLELALRTHDVAVIDRHVCSNPFFGFPGDATDPDSAIDRVEWMAMSILKTSGTGEAPEAQGGGCLGEREGGLAAEAARLRRAIEARDRLIVTTARWLARPLPALCGHLDELIRDPRLGQYQDVLDRCGEHMAAMSRLSRGLDEIASFVQMQVVLRPEALDMMQVARDAIAEVNGDPSLGKVEVKLEGPATVAGSWDRLRVGHLFRALLQTAREHGFDSQVHLRIEDLGQIVRTRLEFTLPHAPALTETGMHGLAYGGAGESDYDRLAVQLWSAREIVRMMGGNLGVSTWADARVVFTLDLPKLVPEEAQGG